ncbi:efflux transporter outer membrane subunit [Polaromonas naphthalenivorans]|uniref:RND efflux system, outer membrane lipoprotein, NodT family n=1 Tax=Polaromonas naphthalenivorans (strain CJ2) TaxID=365044 RepID=A1VU68_POLNA|nr:efflux transporter outer membrane subunit [Polaromonas naphthalenivorans]ABM39196.1 RND efflux system, outer membrane lipoprotein, NodT family [Polaromonas naphthalenivorans CJ2]
MTSRLTTPSRLLIGLLPLWLGACATLPAPPLVSAPVPPQWQAALPHQGSLTDLSQWWRQQGDPVLAELIAAAQAVSPTVASARSRIEQARAARVAAGAALLPTLDASASLSRSRSLQSIGSDSVPVVTTAQAGLQAAWELDVAGGGRASLDAAAQRLLGADAQWHEARVSVAAEVANQYDSLRSCRALANVTQLDAASRQETARLSGLSTQAGFTAPATDALARASAADARGRATRQAALCELDLKALVALSGLAEPDLRQKLAPVQVERAQTAIVSIASVPADVLAQRPDVFSAGREVAAASADVGSAQAARYPRLGLSGSIGAAQARALGTTVTLDTWSIGPLSLSLPLFDGGRRTADVQAAQARYDEAAALYRASVRQAVREVEEALVNLQSTGARQGDAETAVAGYRAAFTGTEALYKNGLASLPELEDARRTLLAAEISRVSLQQERKAAGVALYRAVGGGWTPALARLNNAAAVSPAPASSQ